MRNTCAIPGHSSCHSTTRFIEHLPPLYWRSETRSGVLYALWFIVERGCRGCHCNSFTAINSSLPGVPDRGSCGQRILYELRTEHASTGSTGGSNTGA